MLIIRRPTNAEWKQTGHFITLRPHDNKNWITRIRIQSLLSETWQVIVWGCRETTRTGLKSLELVTATPQRSFSVTLNEWRPRELNDCLLNCVKSKLHIFHVIQWTEQKKSTKCLKRTTVFDAADIASKSYCLRWMYFFSSHCSHPIIRMAAQRKTVESRLEVRRDTRRVA